MVEERVLESSPVESVKERLSRYWEACNEYLFVINNKRSQFTGSAFKEEALGTAVAVFKARVLQLHQACKFKFKYQKDAVCVKALVVLKPSSGMSLSEAEALFDLLTEFLEIEGVTRFEREKYATSLDSS